MLCETSAKHNDKKLIYLKKLVKQFLFFDRRKR